MSTIVFMRNKHCHYASVHIKGLNNAGRILVRHSLLLGEKQGWGWERIAILIHSLPWPGLAQPCRPSVAVWQYAGYHHLTTSHTRHSQVTTLLTLTRAHTALRYKVKVLGPSAIKFHCLKLCFNSNKYKSSIFRPI